MVLVVAVGGGVGETGLWRSASAVEDQISSLQVGGGGPGAVADPLVGVFSPLRMQRTPSAAAQHCRTNSHTIIGLDFLILHWISGRRC